MNQRTLWALFLFALLSVGCAPKTVLQPPLHKAAVVVKVTDGDTITVLRGKQKIKVRLYGIDAPEKKQLFGPEAKQYLHILLYQKEVTLKSHGKGRYGRTIGEVFLKDGTNVNLEMVADGYAWWYEQYAKEQTSYRDSSGESQEEEERSVGGQRSRSPMGMAKKKMTSKRQKSSRKAILRFASIFSLYLFLPSSSIGKTNAISIHELLKKPGEYIEINHKPIHERGGAQNKIKVLFTTAKVLGGKSASGLTLILRKTKEDFGGREMFAAFMFGVDTSYTGICNRSFVLDVAEVKEFLSVLGKFSELWKATKVRMNAKDTRGMIYNLTTEWSVKFLSTPKGRQVMLGGCYVIPHRTYLETMRNKIKAAFQFK